MVQVGVPARIMPFKAEPGYDSGIPAVPFGGLQQQHSNATHSGDFRSHCREEKIKV